MVLIMVCNTFTCFIFVHVLRFLFYCILSILGFESFFFFWFLWVILFLGISVVLAPNVFWVFLFIFCFFVFFCYFCFVQDLAFSYNFRSNDGNNNSLNDVIVQGLALTKMLSKDGFDNSFNISSR